MIYLNDETGTKGLLSGGGEEAKIKKQEAVQYRQTNPTGRRLRTKSKIQARVITTSSSTRQASPKGTGKDPSETQKTTGRQTLGKWLERT